MSPIIFQCFALPSIHTINDIAVFFSSSLIVNFLSLTRHSSRHLYQKVTNLLVSQKIHRLVRLEIKVFFREISHVIFFFSSCCKYLQTKFKMKTENLFREKERNGKNSSTSSSLFSTTTESREVKFLSSSYQSLFDDMGIWSLFFVLKKTLWNVKLKWG